MGPWVILIVLIIVILIVWWALLRNVKNYKPDFDVHGHEEHAEDTHGETGPSRGIEIPIAEAEMAVAEAAPAEAVTIEPAAGVEMRAATEVPLNPEDLTLIEGIGPKVNELLHNNGIHTFAELAAADVARLREILEANGLRFIDPGTWPKQAGLAAEGRMEELHAYMATLRGGRAVS